MDKKVTDQDVAKRTWCSVYNEIVGYHVSRTRAAYRATLYCLIGDTGVFESHGGFRRTRIQK